MSDWEEYKEELRQRSPEDARIVDRAEWGSKIYSLFDKEINKRERKCDLSLWVGDIVRNILLDVLINGDLDD